MSQMLDFQQIKEDHPIEVVAERLGMQLKKQGNQLRGNCPSGQGDERSFVITPAKGVWYSFAMGKGGDAIALVALVNQVSAREAAQWIVGTTSEPEKSKKVDKPSEGFAPLTYLEHDHEAVIALGFEPEDAQKLGIGFAPRGVLRGTVAIPVRTADGILRGYLGCTDATLPKSWHF
jgi:DNA primase